MGLKRYEFKFNFEGDLRKLIIINGNGKGIYSDKII